jgi:hypothetical protein
VAIIGPVNSLKGVSSRLLREENTAMTSKPPVEDMTEDESKSVVVRLERSGATSKS